MNKKYYFKIPFCLGRSFYLLHSSRTQSLKTLWLKEIDQYDPKKENQHLS